MEGGYGEASLSSFMLTDAIAQAQIYPNYRDEIISLANDDGVYIDNMMVSVFLDFESENFFDPQANLIFFNQSNIIKIELKLENPFDGDFRIHDEVCDYVYLMTLQLHY